MARWEGGCVERGRQCICWRLREGEGVMEEGDVPALQFYEPLHFVLTQQLSGTRTLA